MNLVIDASVALKWQFEDEAYRSEALVLLEDYQEGEVDLVTTSLFAYEVLSGIYVAIRMRRLNSDAGEKALRNLISLDIEEQGLDGLADAAFKMALRYDLSPYDCAYLALAEREDFQFITGDKKLFNAVRQRLRWVRWIGDYRSRSGDSDRAPR
jgi:predicted nucleic acid-binding protein